MTKSAALEVLSRLGPISKLFWKTDNLARGERLSLYINDNQITSIRYSLADGRPTDILNIDRVSATDLIAANAQTNGDDIEIALQRLGNSNGRTYKVFKTFHFTTTIHLLLEQTTDRPDAIVVGEVSDEGGEKTIFLKARVEPQHLDHTMKAAN